MNKIKKFIFIISVSFLINSCGTVKEGFQNPKKNSSDEFLVEKKSPLIMPPDFEKLPIPDENTNETESSENSLKELFSDNQTADEVNSSNKNLEETLLDKIKKN